MIDRKQLLTLLAVFALVANVSLAGAAAGGLGLNTAAEQYPETRFVEDRLTIESHDRANMSWLQYEDDNGVIQTIDAHVNGTESGAKVEYRADQLEAKALAEYPRKDGEGNNSAAWIDAGEWATSVSDSTNSALSVSDTDGKTAAGVSSITYSATGMGSGDTATATYNNQSITSDVEKRYLQLVANVETLSGVVEVQIADGGGDYVAAQINATANASHEDVIANQTANGIVYQRQLGQFAVQGSGDGTLDAIESVKIVTSDGDSKVTVTGLNVQKKSRWDFGEDRVPDTSTDDTDDYTDETVYQRPSGGEIQATGLAGLGSAFSDAVVHKLSYIDVEYRMQDKPSAVSVEFKPGEAYPNFQVLDLSYRRTIPSAYDISHGTITLETNQTFLSERYVQLRYAEGVGDTATENVSDSSWIDLSGSLGTKGTWITADSTVSADKTYVIQFETKVTDSQAEILQQVQTGGGGGFWGSSGGGGNPFMSLYNWIAGGIVGLLSAIGLAKRGS